MTITASLGRRSKRYRSNQYSNSLLSIVPLYCIGKNSIFPVLLQRYLEKTASISEEKIAYIDETGINIYLHCRFNVFQITVKRCQTLFKICLELFQIQFYEI